MTLTVRSASTTTATTKGAALTHAEMDANWLHLAQSANVEFVQSGIGAIAGTVSDRLLQRVSVFDYMTAAEKASVRAGAGSADVTAAVTAAITRAKTFASTETEVELEWPAGAYKVTSLDYVGASRVRNKALGAVIIYGSSVGGTSVINVDGTTVTNTKNLDWEGNFSVQLLGSATYQYGIYQSYVTDSRQRISVSGSYSAASVFVDYSWDNTFDITASNSSAGAIHAIKCGTNSVNRNRWLCRTTANSDMAVASVGMLLTGTANEVAGDFSSSQIGLKLSAARGTTVISPYMEVVKYPVVMDSNPQGTVILGGYYEVGTNGAAFDLSSSEMTTIISPRIIGISGGSGRVAFALGASCYGLNVIAPNIADSIDTVYSGTWRGEGGFTKNFPVLVAQWLAFPGTQVSSTDVNTLDDYEEGTWTPSLTAATPGDLNVAYSARTGSYTKVGRLVTANFSIVTSTFTHSTAVGAVRITGLPFASDGSPVGRAQGSLIFSNITKANYTQYAPFVDFGASLFEIWASGSGQAGTTVAITEMTSAGTVELYGTLVYQTAT